MVIALVLGSAAAYVAVLAFKAGFALRYVTRYPAPRPDLDLAVATIVQPILSGDPDLGRALAANVDTLPEARFVWLIDRDDREAAAIAAQVRRDHPGHRIECHSCPPAPAGVNPKLFKLERARPFVHDGAFIVIDDDTRVTREGLAALLAALETHTLATGLPSYEMRGGWASRLVAQFVNNNAALTYLPLLAFAAPITINGMAYAIAVGELDAIGGFEPLWRELADDLAIARRVRAAGGRIAQTPYPQTIATTVRGARHYRALLHRWFLFALVLLQQQRAGWRSTICVLHAVPPVLLWTALVGAMTASWTRAPGWIMAASVAAALLVARALTLMAVQRATTGRASHAAVLSIVSELLQPWHLLHAWIDRRIVWRTRRYIVHANGAFEACE